MRQFHPQRDENAHQVSIRQPWTPTDPADAHDSEKIASFIPCGPVPATLNGIALSSWADAPVTLASWANVGGQIAIDEPPILLTSSKKAAAGVVIEEPDGRIWVVSPTNAFGGYRQTFPKGKADAGLSLQAVAIKECFEESGLRVQIVGLLRDFERSTSVARYYMARRIGGTPADAGWESQAVHLVPKAQLLTFLNIAADRKIAALIGAR